MYRNNIEKSEIEKYIIAITTSLNRIEFKEKDAIHCIFKASNFTETMEDMNRNVQRSSPPKIDLDKIFNSIEGTNSVLSSIPDKNPYQHDDTPLLIQHSHLPKKTEVKLGLTFFTPIAKNNSPYPPIVMKYCPYYIGYQLENGMGYTTKAGKDYLEHRIMKFREDFGKSIQSLAHKYYIGDDQDWSTHNGSSVKLNLMRCDEVDQINPISPPAEVNYLVASSKDENTAAGPGFRRNKEGTGKKGHPIKPAARLQSVLSNAPNEEQHIKSSTIDGVLQSIRMSEPRSKVIKLPNGDRLAAICSVPEPVWGGLLASINKHRQAELEIKKERELAEFFNLPRGGYRYYNEALFLPTSQYQSWGNNDVMAFDNGNGGIEYYTLKYSSNIDIDPDPEKAEASLPAGGRYRNDPTDMPIRLSSNTRRIYRLTFISGKSMMFGFKQVFNIHLPQKISESIHHHYNNVNPSEYIGDRFFVPINIYTQRNKAQHLDYLFCCHMGMKVVQYHLPISKYNIMRKFDRGRTTLDVLI